MFAIVSRPVRRTVPTRAVIMCGKDGPGDVWRWFAESVAQRGILVLRFDPVGVADSPGGTEDVDIPIEQHYRSVQAATYTHDTEDVVAWVCRQYGTPEIYLMGHCGVCPSLLHAAAAAPASISGVVLVTPAVLYSGSVGTLRTYDVAGIKAGYRARLFNAASYWKFVTGRSSYRLMGRLAAHWLKQVRHQVRRSLASLDRTPRPNHPAFNWHFWSGFRAVMAHKIPVLCLLAELDNDTVDFDTEFAKVVLQRSREYQRLCTLRPLAGTDHSFLFQQSRELAFTITMEWLGRSER